MDEHKPCNCTVSFWCASLIRQPWMRGKHMPATRCLCGQRYYSWRLKKWFSCKGATRRLDAD